jgi:hypothetical protein
MPDAARDKPVEMAARPGQRSRMPAEDLPEKPRMRETPTGRAPGCLSLMGGPLLAFGLWMIAQALLLPHEAEAVRLSILTGAFAALAGGWLLVTGRRQEDRRQREQDPRRLP